MKNILKIVSVKSKFLLHLNFEDLGMKGLIVGFSKVEIFTPLK